MKVKLAEGRMLRDPTTRQPMKPDQVRDVPDNALYWRRRLRDGDVVRVDAPPADRSHHARPHHAAAKED